MTTESILKEINEIRLKVDKKDRLVELVNFLESEGVYSHTPFTRQGFVGKQEYPLVCMVESYGAYWNVYSEPLTCQHCNHDLRDLEHGPPFKLELGRIWHDRLQDKSCPSCKEVIWSLGGN